MTRIEEAMKDMKDTKDMTNIVKPITSRDRMSQSDKQSSVKDV
jgi:hypothetical protein